MCLIPSGLLTQSPEAVFIPLILGTMDGCSPPVHHMCPAPGGHPPGTFSEKGNSWCLLSKLHRRGRPPGWNWPLTAAGLLLGTCWALGLLSHPAPGPSLFSSSPGRVSHGRAFWRQMTQSHSLQGCGDSIPARRKLRLRVDWWNPGTPRGHLLETGSPPCLL